MPILTNEALQTPAQPRETVEWVKIMIGGLLYRVRCLNHGHLRPPGCTEQPKVQFNRGKWRIISTNFHERLGRVITKLSSPTMLNENQFAKYVRSASEGPYLYASSHRYRLDMYFATSRPWGMMKNVFLHEGATRRCCAAPSE
jgi:hypothetical protein